MICHNCKTDTKRRRSKNDRFDVRRFAIVTKQPHIQGPLDKPLLLRDHIMRIKL